MKNAYINDFTNTVQIYYDDLSCYDTIPREEEEELFQRYRENDIDARNKIIESNLKFVFNIAKKYKGKGLEMCDLISEGNIGLLKALDKFDETRGIKFITYAVWWIRQSIQEAIQKKGENTYIEDTPSCGDLNIGILDDEEDGEIDNNNGEYNDNYEVITDDMKALLSEMLGKLPSRNRTIMEMYFGLNGHDECTLDEIGRTLNLSKERIRQLKLSSLKILRNEIMASYSEDVFDGLFLG